MIRQSMQTQDNNSFDFVAAYERTEYNSNIAIRKQRRRHLVALLQHLATSTSCIAQIAFSSHWPNMHAAPCVLLRHASSNALDERLLPVEDLAKVQYSPSIFGIRTIAGGHVLAARDAMDLHARMVLEAVEQFGRDQEVLTPTLARIVVIIFAP